MIVNVGICTPLLSTSALPLRSSSRIATAIGNIGLALAIALTHVSFLATAIAILNRHRHQAASASPSPSTGPTSPPRY
jgi:hypothetical protein